MGSTRAPSTGGPERPTYWERLFGRLRVPYTLGALILSAVFGAPGLYLVQFLQSFDVYQALQNPFAPVSETFPLWRSMLADTLFLLVAFVALLMVRYMRTKLVAVEPQLVPLAPEGEETFHKAFGRVSRAKPPILLAVLILVILALPGILSDPGENGLVSAVTPATDPYLFVTVAFGFAILASVMWVYFGAIWGLHQLGKQPLRLKPFYEDPALGVRPLGSLSLSLAFAGFAPLALFASVQFIQPDIFLPTLLLTAVLIPLGVIMFFLPLNNIHRQMLQAKQQTQATIRGQFAQIFAPVERRNLQTSTTTLDDLKNLIALEMADRKAAAIPTWPFDTRIVGRLAAIILSVVAIVLARLVQVVLQV